VFSYFLDIPLSLLGIFLYFLSGFQLFNFLENCKNVNSKNNLLDITIITFPLLLGFFSSYFVYVLEKILKTSCPWCFFFNIPFWIDIDIIFWDLDGRKKF